MKPYMWAILAALVWGCAPILEKMGLSKSSVWSGLVFRSLGVISGMVLIIVFQFAEVKTSFSQMPKGWYFLALGGFMASIVGQIFFYNALKGGEASKVVPLGASYPLISFILGVIVLKEAVTFPKILGLILVVLGAFLLI